MRRLSQNRDLFEASPPEEITVIVSATNTPFQVTFSKLESGGQWTVLQQPTPTHPVEKRKFTMPAGSREFFGIVYNFPPPGQTNPDATYSVSFSSNDGTSDPPKEIFPPVVGNITDLPYEFQLSR